MASKGLHHVGAILEMRILPFMATPWNEEGLSCHSERSEESLFDRPGGAQSMTDCLFCKISRKEIPAKLVYEDPDIFAFEDISPQAPTHILICPRKHIASLTNTQPEDAALLGRALRLAAQLATERGLAPGYRTVINNGRGAGQTVFHLHIHLLGGRDFRWPPG
jgi:histidine triad (HIT) family protein